MRRLRSFTAGIALACLLAAGGCKTRDRVKLEPTEETLALSSTVHMSDPNTAAQLVSGFHQVEQNSWRWTKGKFAVALKPPVGSEKSGARLVTKFNLAEPVMQRLKETKLTATFKGVELGSATYSAAGEYTFTVDVPPAALGIEAVTIDFALDRFLPAGAIETRELGLIVSSIGLEAR